MSIFQWGTFAALSIVIVLDMGVSYYASFSHLRPTTNLIEAGEILPGPIAMLSITEFYDLAELVEMNGSF